MQAGRETGRSLHRRASLSNLLLSTYTRPLSSPLCPLPLNRGRSSCRWTKNRGPSFKISLGGQFMSMMGKDKGLAQSEADSKLETVCELGVTDVLGIKQQDEVSSVVNSLSAAKDSFLSPRFFSLSFPPLESYPLPAPLSFPPLESSPLPAPCCPIHVSFSNPILDPPLSAECARVYPRNCPCVWSPREGVGGAERGPSRDQTGTRGCETVGGVQHALAHVGGAGRG